MNHLAIVRILSILGIWISGLLLLCGVVALALGETPYVFSYGLGAALAGPIGAIILLLTNKPKQKTRPTDGLAVAVLFWLLAPLFCAFPFVPFLNGQSFITAYYESVSCLTTTGHSVLFTDETPLPASLLLWRAVLHMLGTVSTITIAASVLAALNLGGPGIHKSRFFTIPEGSFFDSVPKIIRTTTVISCTIVVILGSLLLIIGVTPREALAGAVSAVSTGLVDPRSANMAPSLGALHASLLAGGLVCGSLGLVVLDQLGQRRPLTAASDPETITFAGSIGIITVLAVLAGLPLIPGIGWSLSSISTSGIALSDPSRFERLPLAVILFPILIGGSALSAAGGIKLARLIVLSKRVVLEFSQLGYRGSVQTFNFRGRRQTERTIMGVWVYLVGYIMASVVGILLLSIMGLSFDDAIRGTIGALSNAGHVLGGMSADIGTTTQFGMLLAMILGRLEIIALIPALNPRFWSR